jgi:hypothetical protein
MVCSLRVPRFVRCERVLRFERYAMAGDEIRAIDAQLSNCKAVTVDTGIVDKDCEAVLVETMCWELGFARRECDSTPGMLETPVAVESRDAVY